MQTIPEDLDKLVLQAKHLSPAQLGMLIRLQASERDLEETIRNLSRQQTKLQEMQR